MAKATASFVEYDPKLGKSVEYGPGDEVPDHVARNLGAHVLDKPVQSSGSDDGDAAAAFDGDAFDAAVAAKVDEELAAKQEEWTAARDASETAALDGEGYGTFDPAGDGVNADAVKTYLTGLDRNTVAGRREFDRVVDAEGAREGGPRKSALPSD
jgi:hypothetical protein